MTYVKTYLPTLKTHVVNLKRDAKDLSRDLQRLEVAVNSDLKLSITENAPKSPFLCVCACVKKSLFGYGFNAGARAIRCTVDIGLNTSGAF